MENENNLIVSMDYKKGDESLKIVVRDDNYSGSKMPTLTIYDNYGKVLLTFDRTNWQLLKQLFNLFENWPYITKELFADNKEI